MEYSFLGSVFNVPKVILTDKDAFNLFNSYRSRAWKIRGVDNPLRSLYKAGNENLYAYRYDWDDHRRFIIADFKELIGAAHATEIPLLTGNNKLVGDYGFLIYPKGPSKRFTSKNMMKFWTNFAKNAKPGKSSNGVEWKKYEGNENMPSSYMILDNRKSLRMHSDNFSFSSLIKDLHKENVRFTIIGDLETIPSRTARGLSDGIEMTKDNSGLNLNLALNYGSRQEIISAVKDLAIRVESGDLKPVDINIDVFDNSLYTSDIPDPDLLIRTSGENRLSNFLLWQIAYTEILMTDTFWPDFREHQLMDAIFDFQSRERRFGKLSKQAQI